MKIIIVTFNDYRNQYEFIERVLKIKPLNIFDKSYVYNNKNIYNIFIVKLY